MSNLSIITTAEVLGKQFQIYGTPEAPLFLAKDVAEWIEHSNSRVMLEYVDGDEKVVRIVYTPGGNQECWFLTENGLYEVLMLSRKPVARSFKREVKRILHELRTKGITATAQTIDNILSDPEFGIRLLTELKQEREERARQEAINAEQQRQLAAAAPKVAFVETFAASSGNILVRDYAKQIAQALGLRGFGQTEMFAWLRDNGFMNLNRYPTQRAVDAGLLHVTEGLHSHSDGSTGVHHCTRITAKGQTHFCARLSKEFAANVG